MTTNRIILISLIPFLTMLSCVATTINQQRTISSVSVGSRESVAFFEANYEKALIGAIISIAEMEERSRACVTFNLWIDDLNELQCALYGLSHLSEDVQMVIDASENGSLPSDDFVFWISVSRELIEQAASHWDNVFPFSDFPQSLIRAQETIRRIIEENDIEPITINYSCSNEMFPHLPCDE